MCTLFFELCSLCFDRTEYKALSTKTKFPFLKRFEVSTSGHLDEHVTTVQDSGLIALLACLHRLQIQYLTTACNSRVSPARCQRRQSIAPLYVRRESPRDQASECDAQPDTPPRRLH